jgi:putative membrane protein
LALLTFVISLWVWDFATGLMLRNIVLGYAAIALLSLVLAVVLAITIKELAAFSRLRRLDGLRSSATKALQDDNLEQARAMTNRLVALYRDRPELKWGVDNLSNRTDEVLDAESLLSIAETEVVAKLDAQAEKAVQAAARQVATVTAIVPIALADVATTLFSNIRMIRQIAEIYGGRSGTLGSWRLTKAVFAHLVATGAVAIGDDLIGSLAGGGLLSKVSRRFGEGVINGALTARVGLAAMDVCRPLPFNTVKRPSVTAVLRQALAGLFASR